MKTYSHKFFKDLYTKMLKIRFCEESFIDPIKNGEIKCPVHLYTGQEAIAAGVCTALGKRCRIFGTHRSHGHFIALGGNINKLVAEVYGKETGCSRGRGGSMHIIDQKIGMAGSVPIVAGTVSLALGAALASSIRGDRDIAVSFFGDGAMGEGVVYESFNFAVLKKLPIIFICENNLYSTHLPIKECRPENNIFKTADSFCMPGLRVDGNDVLKVYKVACKAKQICVKKRTPVFIEAMTYRLHGHVGPDDNVQGYHTDIRPKKEIDLWRAKDPIKRFEKFLLKNNILRIEKMKATQRSIKRSIRAAHDFAVRSAYPDEKCIEKYVYKN